MKKLLLTALLFSLILSTQIFTQPRFNIKEQIKNLTTELELTDSQAIVIEKILVKQQEKIRQTMDSFDGERSEIRSEMRKIRNDTSDKINSVLDEKQSKKYEKYLNENRNRGRANRRSKY